MRSKGAKGGPWSHNLEPTVDILELKMKSKKQKKIFDVFKVVFLSILTGEDHSW